MPATLNPELTALLTEASEWRLMGLLFEYPSAEWRANLEALLPSLQDHSLRAMAEGALQHATEGLHFALFGPAGTVPVREVTYRGGVQFGYLMAELAAFYEAFGYEPQQVEEAPDHLAVQLGFLAFLRLKQVHAMLQEDPDRAALTAEAATTFLKDHLAVQAEPVLARLENFAPEYLVEAGKWILERTGPAPASGYPLGNLDDEDDAMSCGPSAASADGELIQLQP
jgi:nitrate reductase assembly molybdenum cofactor insertion protein NarJ